MATQDIQFARGTHTPALGAAGAVAVMGSATACSDTFPVHAVDTVGAGDGFAAGYISPRGGPAESCRNGSIRLARSVRW